MLGSASMRTTPDRRFVEWVVRDQRNQALIRFRLTLTGFMRLLEQSGDVDVDIMSIQEMQV